MENAIVITGAASGIGAAAATRLLDRGEALFNLDIHPSADTRINNIACDLADPDAIDNAIGQLPQTIGALVHVAGIAPGPVPDEKVMAINFLGMRHLTEGLLQRIKHAGRVVIVASSAGRDWRDNRRLVDDLLDTPDFNAGNAWLSRHHNDWQIASYKFSKQCAAAYTYRAVGLGRGRQLRVNCVNPGIVETQLSPQFREMVGRERYDWIVEQSGRAGKPDDIAQVLEFLTVGECDWLNGVELTVDGGYYAGLVGEWINREEMP